MALALSVTLDDARLAARISVSGIPAGTDELQVERLSPSGNVAGVRGAAPATISSGQTTLIVRDYEIPFEVDVLYTATAYAAGVAGEYDSEPFSIAYDDCDPWLVDLAKPTNSYPVELESLRELAYDAAVGVHRILSRRAPVLTALPAWTPSSELIVLTKTLEGRDRMRALLGSGYPFLLRTDPEQGIGNMYLSVASQFVEERVLTLGTQPERRFRVACVQVERPDPSIYVPLAPALYSDVKGNYATYAALKAAVASYDELAYTYPESPDYVPIVPWLPDDV